MSSRPNIVLSTIGAAILLAALAISTEAAPEQSPATQGTVSATLRLGATRLVPGQRTGGEFRLDSQWPELPPDAHIAIVADASGSMFGEHNTRLKEALRRMVGKLDLQPGGATRVALVEFNSSARRLCALTDDGEAIRRCIGLIGAGGGTGIDTGMRIGLGEIESGRATGVAEVMVVFTDGGNNTGCPPVLGWADAAKSQDVLVITVTMGDSTDEGCMARAASSARHHYHVPDSAPLPDLFASIGARIEAPGAVEGATIDLQLPAHLRLVAGSVAPRPAEEGPSSARWDLGTAAADSLVITFEVEATADGDAPAGMAAAFQLKSGADPTFGVRSEPLVVGVPACMCAPTAGRFEAERATTDAVPRPFLAGESCAVDVRRGASVGWARYELCGPGGPSWVTLSGDGTVVVYQPAFDAARPCLYAVASGPAGLPLAADIESGPFIVAVYEPEGAEASQRTIELGLPCGAAIPPEPTPTAAPPPRSTLFLPIALRTACVTRRPHDVVLVVDTSHSMQELLPPDGSKFDAARAAVDVLLGSLDAEDRVAVVTFAASAELRQPLTGNHGAIRAALANATTAEGTSIEAGLREGREALGRGQSDPGRRGLIVLLTDGRSHPAPPSAAIVEADQARAEGLLVYALGIGGEVDQRTLLAVAGRAQRFHAVAHADEVAEAFRSIAADLGCGRDGR